jgi:hypothetical protein
MERKVPQMYVLFRPDVKLAISRRENLLHEGEIFVSVPGDTRERRLYAGQLTAEISRKEVTNDSRNIGYPSRLQRLYLVSASCKCEFDRWFSWLLSCNLCIQVAKRYLQIVFLH